MTWTTESALNILYPSLEPTLIYRPTDDEWVIETSLFVANKEWPNNSFQPNLRNTPNTYITTGNVESYTLGVPLIWVLIYIFSCKNAKTYIRATASVLFLSAVALILVSSYQIEKVLSEDILLRILTDSYYVMLPPPSNNLLLSILKPIVDYIGVLATLVAPTVIILGKMTKIEITTSS